ncbi:hypothetical protein IGI04_030420 [Brassica rapa subsp. trilocularis]|uniref:Ig-like domain-containing protein n=1 Tax=Brassica rapa subsp. trilocularis TaxID=1813537 RepID=A0ABQ7LQP6_BRACM|nr:hypothetical protein IGI04_030420 [Brassica rapa subsp. trilocularis]
MDLSSLAILEFCLDSVAFSGLRCRVWSRFSNNSQWGSGLELHWMRDGPARTKEAGNSAIFGTTQVHVPATKIFKETTTYFRIYHNLSIFLSQPHVTLIYLLFLFLLNILRYFFEKKPYSRTPLLGFATLKRETAPSLSSREDYPEPSFCFCYSYAVLFSIDACVFLCHG